MGSTSIYAHRGLWLNYPENSASAFKAAFERGYSLETDLRRTKDDHIVVIHDGSTKRLFDTDLTIADHTLAQVKTARFRDLPQEGVLTLPELLAIIRRDGGESRIALQMKSFEEGTAILIADDLLTFDKAHPEFRIFDKVFLFDITKEIGVVLKQHCPKLKRSYSLGEDVHFPDARYPTMYTRAQLDDEETCDIVWGDEWASPLYTRELIEAAHAQGREFIAISPELHGSTDPKHPAAGNVAALRIIWRNLLAWGVDGICTDYTEEVMEMMRDG